MNNMTPSLDDIIATSALERRISHEPDYEAESDALSCLASAARGLPKSVPQLLAEAVLTLTHAHSAGLSIAEELDGRKVFRWHATAGEFKAYLGQTIPYESSPSRVALERDCPLLMTRPTRYYRELDKLHAPIAELLLVPFRRDDRPIGTLWAVAHGEDKQFDREDLRLMMRLAEFAAMSIQMLDELGALKTANTALTNASMRKTEYLAMLTHELRNPLSAIAYALPVLRDYCESSSEATRALDVVERQAAHVSRLVDDAMDVARMSLKKLEVRKRQVEVSECIRDAVDASLPYINSRGHTLRTMMSAQKILLDADPMRLSQALTNLLCNAARFTPEGGEIVLSLARDGQSAVIAIKDNGAGIDARKLRSIFTMFEQGSDQHFGGLGMGLAIVKEIVELHQGTIEVASEGPGKGSEFTVRLPIALATTRGENNNSVPEDVR